MSFIPETIIRALCWTLLHSLWQGLILAVVAGAVMLLTKRAKSAARYTVLAVLLLVFLGVSGYTFFREMTGAAIPKSAQIVAAPVAAGPVIVADSPAAGTHRVSGLDQLVQYFNAHASIVVVIWFIFFLGRFVNLLSGVVHAQRIRHYQTSPVPVEWQERLGILLERLKISRPVKLLESALIKVPVVVGWLKPVILVPVGMLAQLPADQVESILLHELAHISRRDYVFNIVQHLVDTLFFFNPALLWVSSLIRTERENCCDDVAIRETRSRRQLIEALVSFHEYRQTTQGYALGFGGEDNSMVRRVERIVYKKNHSLNAGERLLLMGGVMLLCGAMITINSSRAVEPVLIKKTVKQTEGVKDAVVNEHSSKASVFMALSRVQRKKPEVVLMPDTSRPDTSKPAGTLSRADVELLIRAHDHGVTPEFISAFKSLGFTVSVEQAIELADHGVSTDFIRAIQKEGFGKISLETAVKLVDHGVNGEFIHKVRALGFPNLTLNEAVTLVDHGVTSDFIEKWKEKSGGKLVLSDYIKLRDAGIEPS